MSYRGRPSRGCEGCRTRKVKCDEAKPVCSRCSNSGHECRYRDQTDMLFRNQTAVAAQRAEDSWRRRSKSHQRARSESSASHSSRPNYQLEQTHRRSNHGSRSRGFTSSNTTSQKASVISSGKERIAPAPSFQGSSIAPTVKSDLCRLAYERFVYDFVTPENPNRPPEEPSDALYTFVPLLYQHAAPDSCLVTIVNAVSYINFSNRYNSPQAARLAEESFGEGIKLLSNMIADKTLAASNDALCSVLLMGFFEILADAQQQGCYASHQHGVNALLQLRTTEEYYSNTVSVRLYEVAYTRMLVASLQSAKRPPIPLQDGLSVRKHLPGAYHASTTLFIRLVWREAQLHALWHELKQSEALPRSRFDLQDILQTALDLDSEYQVWESTLPEPWKCQAEPNSPETRRLYDSVWQELVLGSRGAPKEIHTCSNLKRSYVWGFHRTSRMFLLRDTLEILNWMLRMPGPELDVSSPHGRMDSARFFVDATQNASTGKTPSLSDLSLRTLHSSITSYMVDLIEQGCSAVLGAFIVPVGGKSLQDVMGIRGYLMIWPLGTMDSILRSGLVPDCNAPTFTPTTTSSPSQIAPSLQSAPPTVQAWAHPIHQYDSMATTEHGSSALPPVFSQPRHRHSTSLPHTPTQSPPSTSPKSNTTSKKPHAFDITPRHPYDHPINLPSLDFNITKPKTIDIAAKREWLNSLLYYIGAELGMKRALSVPVMEGYIPIVKPRVDKILGR